MNYPGIALPGRLNLAEPVMSEVNGLAVGPSHREDHRILGLEPSATIEPRRAFELAGTQNIIALPYIDMTKLMCRNLY